MVLFGPLFVTRDKFNSRTERTRGTLERDVVRLVLLCSSLLPIFSRLVLLLPRFLLPSFLLPWNLWPFQSSNPQSTLDPIPCMVGIDANLKTGLPSPTPPPTRQQWNPKTGQEERRELFDCVYVLEDECDWLEVL